MDGFSSPVPGCRPSQTGWFIHLKGSATKELFNYLSDLTTGDRRIITQILSSFTQDGCLCLSLVLPEGFFCWKGVFPSYSCQSACSYGVIWLWRFSLFSLYYCKSLTLQYKSWGTIQSEQSIAFASRWTKNLVLWPHWILPTPMFLLLLLPEPHFSWAAATCQLSQESHRLNKPDRTP